jgi:hypothetical protein
MLPADGTIDAEFTFGRHPTTAAPFPFTERQFARLLAWRSALSDGIAIVNPSDDGWNPRAERGPASLLARHLGV